MGQCERIKRFLPNVLTILRMVCAALLLFFRPLSVWFFALYAIAGLTDVLDGYFARRFHAQSVIGARLDSAADFLLCAVLLYLFIPVYSWPRWVLLWIAAVCFIRFAALGVCYIRFKRLAFLHTWSNKAAGLLLFLSPVLFWIAGNRAGTAILLAVSTISAIEELAIEATATTLDLNQTTLFSKKT